MRIFYRLIPTILFVFAGLCGFSQNRFFSDENENNIRLTNEKRVLIPKKYRTIKLESPDLLGFLTTAPREASMTNFNQAPVLGLPMPDGSTAQFRIWESSIQEAALQAKFSEIRTYAGQGITDPYATVRIDYSPYFGFHAQILSPSGNIYIDPFARGNIQHYISYFNRDNIRTLNFHCENDDSEPPQTRGVGARPLAGACRGTQLYVYRLAVANTGEYAAAVGATTPAALHAAIVTSVNRVVGVYERELAVRLVLVANNELVEFLDPSADPFNGNNNSTTLINESQNVITANIGSGNFDIGHTFSTGGGGLAGVGVVCLTNNKARGITGNPFPVGDSYDIDFVAHEMGHQFGASHSFNSETSNCNGNRSPQSAYEVGSGTTIMGYAGICGSDNIEIHSDAFFHTKSFDQISDVLEGSATCHTTINTGNTLPVITAMNNNGANIPLNTPFTLTGSATDANGDAITYDWEEWDLSATGGTWNSGATSTTAPIFRSRIPKTSGSRTFPDLAIILANYPTAVSPGPLKGEVLPQVGRELKFRLTVRDNRANGGSVVTGGDGCQSSFASIFQINAIDATGPFVVTSPNGGESYPGGSTQTVTWNVAGTNAAPINTTNVRISLSLDGGLTYPTELLASTSNDGSEAVVLPFVATSAARIKIEAVGNVYFDISNANFTITAPASSFDFTSPAAATVSCASATSATVTLGVTATGGFSSPVNLAASGNPAGTTIVFSTNPVVPGNTTNVTLTNVNTLNAGTYSITITGSSGALTRTRVINFTVQSGTAPTITAQPVDQQVCAGTNATFSVSAAGSGFTYQWQLSIDGGANYSNIAGATSSTYTITGTTTAQNNTRYRVLVITQCATATSNSALLTVSAPPSITQQPQSQTLCSGTQASFSVTATGGGLTYQWQLSTDGGSTYSPAPGGNNNSTYTTTPITPAMNNYRYRVVVNGNCSPSVTSTAAVLTVVSPPVVTADAQNAVICETGNVSFSVAGTSSGTIFYQWQVSTNGGATFTNLSNDAVYSGVTTPTLTVSNVTASMNGYRYRALLSNATCTTPVASNTVTAAVLTVNARPTVTLTATNASIIPGQTTTITANILPSGTGFTIRWYRNGILLPGVTGTTYTTGVEGVGDYRVEIVNTTTGCNNQSPTFAISATPSNRLFIFPIPNNGRFTIAYYNPGGTSTNQQVVIYDARGALVYQKTFAVALPYQLLPIDTWTASSGVYLVVLLDSRGNKIADGKVVVSLRR